MRRAIPFIALAVLVIVVGALLLYRIIIPFEEPEETEEAEMESAPELPRLYAKGNKLVNENNTITRLRGVSIADPYHLEIHDRHLSKDIFIELTKWRINVVRIPIHPGWWQAKADYCEKYLDKIISWCKYYEFYAILDWHAIGNPLTGATQNPEWKEQGYTIYNSSLELAERAWVKLAERYGKNSTVIFELFNEPAPIPWQEPDWEGWRNEATKLIDKVRVFAPDTLILVSGWHWSYDLSGFEYYPIERENIAYVAHVYASHDDPLDWEDSFGFLSDTHPIVVTEWGFSPTVSSTIHYYGSRKNFGQLFLRYMDAKNMSWLSWCFHPTWEPKMINNWNFGPTEGGLLVQQALVPDITIPAVVIDTPDNESTVEGTVFICGTASDDVGLLTVKLRMGETLHQNVNISFTSEYKEASWSFNWNTLTVENGEYMITVIVVDASSNQSVHSISTYVDNSS